VDTGPRQVHHVLDEFLLTLAEIVLAAVLRSIAEFVLLIVTFVNAVRTLVNVETAETLGVLEAHKVKLIHWLPIGFNACVFGEELTVTAIVGDAFSFEAILFQLGQECTAV